MNLTGKGNTVEDLLEGSEPDSSVIEFIYPKVKICFDEAEGMSYGLTVLRMYVNGEYYLSPSLYINGAAWIM